MTHPAPTTAPQECRRCYDAPLPGRLLCADCEAQRDPSDCPACGAAICWYGDSRAELQYDGCDGPDCTGEGIGDDYAAEITARFEANR